jgi:hypothetical protein
MFLVQTFLTFARWKQRAAWNFGKWAHGEISNVLCYGIPPFLI